MCALPAAAGLFGGTAGKVGRAAMFGLPGLLMGGGGKKKPPVGAIANAVTGG